MNKHYPQSRLGGIRGCLCKDNTYSIKCCDGSMYAQGIGNIYSDGYHTEIKKPPRAFSEGFSNGFE